MFYEDLDVCARIRGAGYEVWFVATTPVVHLYGATRKRVARKSLVDSFRSTDRFFLRHGPSWRRRILRWLTLPEMVLRSVVWIPFLLRPSSRPRARERLQAYAAIIRELFAPQWVGRHDP